MTEARAVFLSTLPAGRRERRLAMLVLLLSVVVFVTAAPFAKAPLVPVPAFIPIYESALIINDLITAALLFCQFRILRFRALLALGSGYLFSAFSTVAHALTFPGLFAPTGLLGAGPQSTAWLYMFWHGGFPLFVLAYALLKARHPAPIAAGARLAVTTSITVVLALACAVTLIATAGQTALPPIMRGNQYTPTMIGVVSTVWALSLLALLAVARRRSQSMLDLWLTVTMTAWLFDIALSAVLNAGRFDLGFYAGRVYGLLASAFVLMVLLLENSALYVHLAQTHGRERQKALDARRLSVQLASANELLADKNQQLESAGRLKSEFLSSMSHELRTPLNAIIGFSEMMKDGLTGTLSTRQQSFVGHIHQSGQHLLALINDILDLSKIEAGKVEVELEPVDLDALLAESAALLDARVQAKQIQLRHEAPERLGVLRADRRRLRQILDNLLTNAMKFTPPGGLVSLRASRVDRARAASALPGFEAGMRMPLPDSEFTQFIELSVTDTGIGMRAEDAKKLFTPFTQIANPLTRGIEGTGLGLAMVRRLAELHGGTVAVTTEPGRGSCFTVWLAWQPVIEPQPEALKPTLSPRLRGSGPTALVVEDDDKAATLMRLQLEAEGFEVRHAASAEEALALSGDWTPDIITLDILLPGMDGWDFLARLREVPAWEGVPVVVVSVVANEGRGFSLGASMVLQKPIGRDALAKGLARLGLVSDGGRSATVLVIDDDPNAVEILASHLHQAGHVALRALGGREGIELARRFRPDAIALDLEMPDINGFAVVESLKSNPSTAQIPIVVITAKQLTKHDREQLNGHILDIVDKSEFNHGRFINEVQRAMHKNA